MQPISHSTQMISPAYTRKPPANLKVVSIQRRSKSLKEIVDEHLIFSVIPALAAYKSVKVNEIMPSYNPTFKMLLDREIPARTVEETNVLFRDYIPRLSYEITTKILDVLDKSFVSSYDYHRFFQKKFKFVYSEFLKIDNEGCALSLEEGNSIHSQVVLVAECRLIQRWNVHKAVEIYITRFLSPFKKGLIPFEDETAINRPKLMQGLEKYLIAQFNRLPYKPEYVETLAMHHYLFECAQYILDQFEKETGVVPLFDECKQDYRYQKIFRGCLEAVLDSTDIDFPDIVMSSRKVSEYLYGFMKLSERMSPLH